MKGKIFITFCLLFFTCSFASANSTMPYSDLDVLDDNPLFGTRPWEQELYTNKERHENIILSECTLKEKELFELEKKRIAEIKRKKAISLAKKKAEEETKLRAEQEAENSKQVTDNNSYSEKTYEYQKSVASKIENSEEYKAVQGKFKWNGPVINRSNGVVQGPHGRETYYNLPMGGVINIMRNLGNKDRYWVRSDGCKMLGNYIMVAAKVDSSHKRGRIIKCSRGFAIVCDTGSFLSQYPNGVDVAVDW